MEGEGANTYASARELSVALDAGDMLAQESLDILPDETRVYPGHEYLARNLEFTLDREPDNAAAPEFLEKARAQDPDAARVTTLGEEKRINTFFRLHSPTVISRLREVFPEVGDRPDAKTVFLKLRELRNRW